MVAAAFTWVAGETVRVTGSFDTWTVTSVECSIRYKSGALLWHGGVGSGFTLTDDGFVWLIPSEVTALWPAGTYRFDLRCVVGGGDIEYPGGTGQITITRPQTRGEDGE